MLIFVFSALIVVLDQFFKRYIMRTLEIGERGPEIIPGILELTRWENDGAMLNILSGQRWLLAGIAFVAAVVLILILLRYNEGFWGSLGLASVLGGTVGNLADRIFNDGAVVDMFRTTFIDFPIFNFADIFITLGFGIFIAHFISITIKEAKAEKVQSDDYADEEYYDEEYEEYSESQNEAQAENEPYVEFPEVDSMVSTSTEQTTEYSAQQEQYVSQAPPSAVSAEETYAQHQSYENQPQSAPEYAQAERQEIVLPDVFDSVTDVTPEINYTMDELGIDFDINSAVDYDVDELLKEYGLDDDD